MNENWSQQQNWRELLPEPWLIKAAARDFARESADMVVANMPPGQARDLLHAGRVRLVYDCYMTGVLEFAKAVTRGKFEREPWRTDTLPDDGILEQYGDFYASLDEAPPLAAAPVPDLSLDGSDARAHTQHYLKLYQGQPCEAYGRALFVSLLRWPSQEAWKHFGLVSAIYDETRRYRAGSRFFDLLFSVYFRILRALRSRYAGTWNDYYICRWTLQGSRNEAVRRSCIAELHRRVHLAENRGPRWEPVSASAAWAVRSLRGQYTLFDVDWRAVVNCLGCNSRDTDTPKAPASK